MTNDPAHTSGTYGVIRTYIRVPAPIPHVRTYLRRVRTAQEYAQSRTGSRTAAPASSQFSAPLCAIWHRRLGDPTDRQHAANDHLDGLKRSADGGGAAEHDCEHITRGNGCQSGQELWQVAAGVCLSQGRLGDDNRGQANEQHTCTKVGLADAPPPAKPMSSHVLQHG